MGYIKRVERLIELMINNLFQYQIIKQLDMIEDMEIEDDESFTISLSNGRKYLITVEELD